MKSKKKQVRQGQTWYSFITSRETKEINGVPVSVPVIIIYSSFVEKVTQREITAWDSFGKRSMVLSRDMFLKYGWRSRRKAIAMGKQELLKNKR